MEAAGRGDGAGAEARLMIIVIGHCFLIKLQRITTPTSAAAAAAGNRSNATQVVARSFSFFLERFINLQ